MKSVVHGQFSAMKGRKLSGTSCNVTMCSTFGSTNGTPTKPPAFPVHNPQVDTFPCKAISLAVNNTHDRLEEEW